MFEKAKMALEMANPIMQVKLSKIFDWVDRLFEASRETGIDVGDIRDEGDFQDVLFKIFRKAKVHHIEEKNALVLELGKKKKLKLILTFKLEG